MQPEGIQQQVVGQVTSQVDQMNSQVVVVTKSSLPAVVGVIFCISQVIGVLLGLMIVMGGALLGGIGAQGDSGDMAAAGGIIAVIGVILMLVSATGVYSGVLIAQRKKFGVHLAWGLIGASVVLSIASSVFGDAAIDVLGLGCNGICAVWVGLPLMIASASQHME